MSKGVATKEEEQAATLRPEVPAKANQSETKRAEAIFAVLAVFGVVGLVFGVVALSKNIRSPFVLNSSTLASGARSNATQTPSANELQNQDTDEDGLNDFDELYQYKTSPYLADSDSDDLSDKEELESGNDPNCPTGQDCTGFASLTNTNGAAPTGAGENANAGVDANSSVSELPTTATGDVDIAKLREILKNSGAPAYVVDSTDDATLLQLYQETLGEQAGAAGTNASLNENTNSTTPDADSLAALRDLSASEIRQLLVENGADEALLSQASDEEIRQIFLEAIDSEVASSQ